jgi:hypothetical protein
MTRLYLFMLALALVMAWFVNSGFDPLNAQRKAVENSVSYSSSTSYDVEGLNDLVGRLDSKADKIADLWNITDADLHSHVNIFGEKE